MILRLTQSKIARTLKEANERLYSYLEGLNLLKIRPGRDTTRNCVLPKTRCPADNLNIMS